MLDDREITDRVTEIVRANLNQPSLQIGPRTRAEDVPGWDSIKMVDIVLDTEDAFAIRLSAEDIDALEDVGDLIAAIRRQTG